MADFQTIAAELLTGVQNAHPNTSALLKAAMVRQLAQLQPEIAPFMEKSGNFATVANRATYDGADAGFPDSLLRFERLYYDMGSYKLDLNIVDMDAIREGQEHPSIAYPILAAWYEEKLQIAPAPAGIYTIKWDAILDSTKDTATGALLTTSSTTETNGWFSSATGKVAFKHLCWADYFMTSVDTRPDMAQSHQALASLALARLREGGKKRKAANSLAVAPNAFDQYAVTGDLARRLFPGAHI